MGSAQSHCRLNAVPFGARPIRMMWGPAVRRGRQERISPSPVVGLNRAVAVAIRDSPEAGLALLEAIEVGTWHEYHLLPAARADLLRRIGRMEEAAWAYRAALDLVANDRERRFLIRRLAEVEASSAAGNRCEQDGAGSTSAGPQLEPHTLGERARPEQTRPRPDRIVPR